VEEAYKIEMLTLSMLLALICNKKGIPRQQVCGVCVSKQCRTAADLQSKTAVSWIPSIHPICMKGASFQTSSCMVLHTKHLIRGWSSKGELLEHVFPFGVVQNGIWRLCSEPALWCTP